MKSVLDIFAAGLKSARKGKHTQQSLADALGVEQSTVAQWESARNLPIPQTIDEISKELGVNPDMLFKNPTEPPPTVRSLTKVIEAQEEKIQELTSLVNPTKPTNEQSEIDQLVSENTSLRRQLSRYLKINVSTAILIEKILQHDQSDKIIMETTEKILELEAGASDESLEETS